MYLYRVTVEVGHMDGTELPRHCAGGFVGVYVRAKSIESALAQAEQVLRDDCFFPVRTHDATEVDLSSDSAWQENSQRMLADGEPSFDELTALQIEGDYLYSAFRLFSHEH